MEYQINIHQSLFKIMWNSDDKQYQGKCLSFLRIACVDVHNRCKIVKLSWLSFVR